MRLRRGGGGGSWKAAVFGGLGWVLLLTSCGDPLARFEEAKLADIDEAVYGAIEEKQTPGAVVWLEHRDERYVRAYGNKSVEPEVAAMKLNTIFDLASLTKVVATAPSIMLLLERDLCELDAPVQFYIDEFDSDQQRRITLRHLLTHTSGLRPGLSPTVEAEGGKRVPWEGYETAVELACREEPRYPPGSRFVYSDINFILLGEVVRRVGGSPLDVFAQREIYAPLKMVDTGFNPGPEKRSRIAPTQRVEGEMLLGVVHDPTARRMGGVAGHAGLFSTAADLARYTRMMMHEGEIEGVRIFQPETVAMMTRVQSPAGVPEWRGLGWDIDSPYCGERGSVFPVGGYGHTGWTGPSLWIDPFSQTLVIFLCNRVHPDGKGNILPLRAQLGTLAAKAIQDFHFDYVPGAIRRVRNGIDVLVEREFEPLDGLRVGLITNQTGTDRSGTPTAELLENAEHVKLAALFSPEHGLRGRLDRNVPDTTDPGSGLPVFSLYGENRRPTPEQLEGLDALVFDIQDIGCRFYTYISTMGLAMEGAAEAGIKFFVLDRINPINGVTVRGPLPPSGESTFTGYHNIPPRHGMTVGELARMFRAERRWNLDLQVVPVEGWRREQYLDETGLRWINPSPNMRRLNQAILYPGIGLLETTALSVGRGTDTPFEILGAPYINDMELAEELDRLKIPGIRFIPVRFTPTASKFMDQECGGVQLVLIDRSACPSVRLGVAIAQVLHRLYAPDFDIAPFNRLLMHPSTIEAIRAGKQPDEIVAPWAEAEAAFRNRRKPFLLYP